MATIELGDVATVWPVGTAVNAYEGDFIPPGGGPPAGSPLIQTAVVGSDGGLVFNGLEDDQLYVAYQVVSGLDRYMRFSTFLTDTHGPPGLNIYPTKAQAIDGDGRVVIPTSGVSTSIIDPDSDRIKLHMHLDPDFSAAEVWVAAKPALASPGHGQLLTAYGPPLVFRGESQAGFNAWSDTNGAAVVFMDF